MRLDSKIQHVVIIVQENRSFNNLFYGYPGAKTATYGYNSSGKKIVLQPVTIATKWDLEHNAKGYFALCNGKGTSGTRCRMNGFDNEAWGCVASGEPKCPNANPPYSYVPQRRRCDIFRMAKQYVLADEMYASDFDISSFISHQYIIAAVNPDSTYDYPDGSWGCPGARGDAIKVLGRHRNINDPKTVFPCWDSTTLGDELTRPAGRGHSTQCPSKTRVAAPVRSAATVPSGTATATAARFGALTRPSSIFVTVTTGITTSNRRSSS